MCAPACSGGLRHSRSAGSGTVPENIGTHGVIISVRRYLVAACVKNDGVRASFSHPRFRARGREKAAARRTLGSRRIRFETFAVAAVGHPAMHVLSVSL